MQIIRHYQDCPSEAKGAVIALGNFDGIHKGHQEILRRTIELAKQNKSRSAVMTFEPHPVTIFRPDTPPQRITPFHDKAERIASYGIDVLFTINFDHAFSKTSADSFVENILVKQLGAKIVVIGHDFVFGHNREGNAALLAKRAKELKFDLVQVEVVSSNGEVYSSTKIRDFLKKGEVEKANDFLGYNYCISGKIEEGEKRGRDIGYPTANIYLKDHLRPRFGVYQVKINIEGDNRWLPAIASLGQKPTYTDNRDVLEIFIFDFDQQIYNMKVKVEFLKFIRDEEKFPDTPTLVEQINKDCEQVKRLFKNFKNHD